MRRFLVLAATSVLVMATACGGGSGGSSNFDPNSVSGTVVLSGWQASPEEGQALQAAISGFQAKYPKVKVDYEPIAGDYPTAMVAKFSAHQPPDVFYVDSSVAPDWIKQGVLQSLDDWAGSRGFDTSQFYPGYLNAFKGTDGKTYGYPKDGNTLAMAYNPDMLSAAGVQPPTTYDDMLKVGAALKAKGQVAYSMSTSLDRILTFVYGDGGALLNSNKTQDAINDKFKTAVAFYLSLFQMGYAKSPSQLGVDWNGKALGEKKAAIIFEGGWLDSYMKGTFPNVPYKWAEVPAGSAGKATLGFTVSYSIGKDSPHKDAAWLLLTYLTGPEGMKLWTQGGVANPSRKDVAPPAGKDILVNGASYAHPWSFIPGFSKVNDAFNNAFEAAVEGKGSVDDVVSKTKAALDQQLNQP